MTTTDIEKAEAVLADLDSKLIRLKQRGVELGDERSQIALAAHTGDAKARAHLDAVNAQIVTYHSESDSLFDAIKAQEKLVAQAKHEEQSAEARDRALALRNQYKRFVKLADIADEHLRSFVAAAGELKKTMDAIHAINPGSAPTAQQLLVFGEMAVQSQIMGTMWSRCVSFLPPNQRHAFPKLARGWAEPALRAIDHALGDEKKEPVDA
jgi:hypothetical protein